MSAEGEEFVRRLRCALAEEGYGDIRLIECTAASGLATVASWTDVPSDVWWRAFDLAHRTTPCWSCWYKNSGDNARSIACARGDCQSGPDTPKVPPRRVYV
jgi:hypothetical protein